MLTDQAYRGHARPAKAKHRRVYKRLPVAFRPSLSKEETPSDDQGQHSRQIRLRGAAASCKRDCHQARTT